MDNTALTLVGAFIILIGFMFSGQLLGMALASAGIVILFFMVGPAQVAMIGRVQWNISESFTLAAMPLFIFMGYIIIHSKLSDLVYDMASPLVSRIPGGLLHTNVVAGSLFGALCGSSVAGAAAIGTVALPQLKERGYDKSLTYGSIAAGGTMSALIPPSLTMIIYGAWVGQSIGALFIGGVIPGVIMTILFMIYIAIRATINPNLSPKEMIPVSINKLILTAMPVVILFLVVMGTIYSGIATPTEAAGVGAFMALVISAIYRRLSWQALKQAALDTAKLTCMVMFLVVGAQLFAMAISMLGIPKAIEDWVFSLNLSKAGVMTLVVILFLIAGMFLDAVPTLLMLVPLTYPIMMKAGFNPIWFGIVTTMCIQIGLLSPPFGMDVFIVNKIAGGKDLGIAFKGAVPFALIMIATMLIVTLFPSLVTWLPSTMLGRKY